MKAWIYSVLFIAVVGSLSYFVISGAPKNALAVIPKTAQAGDCFVLDSGGVLKPAVNCNGPDTVKYIMEQDQKYIQWCYTGSDELNKIHERDWKMLADAVKTVCVPKDGR